jgi:hypothetical protein
MVDHQVTLTQEKLNMEAARQKLVQESDKLKQDTVTAVQQVKLKGLIKLYLHAPLCSLSVSLSLCLSLSLSLSSSLARLQISQEKQKL